LRQGRRAKKRAGLRGRVRLTRLLELARRWGTWPLAAIGLLAWFGLLYVMVGDLL
jgi:hypothetical protein